jgi:hypothetical protein
MLVVLHPPVHRHLLHLLPHHRLVLVVLRRHLPLLLGPQTAVVVLHPHHRRHLHQALGLELTFDLSN